MPISTRTAETRIVPPRGAFCVPNRAIAYSPFKSEPAMSSSGEAARQR